MPKTIRNKMNNCKISSKLEIYKIVKLTIKINIKTNSKNYKLLKLQWPKANNRFGKLMIFYFQEESLPS